MAEALLGCLQEQIALVEAPPAKVEHRPGQTVDALLSITDDECCSGLAWVRIAQVYPSAAGAFPLQDQTAENPCNPMSWAVELELGAVRCAPTPDAYSLPDGTEWAQVTNRMMQDAAAFRRAVICCFDDLDLPFLLGAWQPLPVAGRCAGGTQLVTVAAEWVDCCAAPESPAESP